MHRFALLILPVALFTVPLYPRGETQAADVLTAATAPEPRTEPCAAEAAAHVALEERAPKRRIIPPDLLGGAYPSMSVPLSRRG